MGTKARCVRIPSRSNVRVPPQNLRVRRAPYAVDFIEVRGSCDIAKRRRIGRVERAQTEEEPKVRVPDNVRTHKEPPWVSTVIKERWANSDRDRAKLATVDDELCI